MARQKTKICPSCNRLFRARVDAKACSDRCRKRLYRAKLALATEAETLKQDAEHIVQEVESKIEPEFATEGGYVGEATIQPSFNSVASASTPQPSVTVTPQSNVPQPTTQAAPAEPAATPSVTTPAPELNISPLVTPPAANSALSVAANPTIPTPAAIPPVTTTPVAQPTFNGPQPTQARIPVSLLASSMPVESLEGASVVPNQAGSVSSVVNPLVLPSNALPASATSPFQSGSLEGQPTQAVGAGVSPIAVSMVADQAAKTPRRLRLGLPRLAIASMSILVVMGLAGLIATHLPKSSKANQTQSPPVSASASAITPDDSVHINRATVIGNSSTLTATGPSTFVTNSPHALVVQDTTSSDVLVVDTTNHKIGINLAPAGTGAALQVSGNISATGSLQAGGGSSLGNSSLVINSKTVCTAEGCAVGPQATNINANQIASGTLSDNHLSPNVALLGANQTFTGNNSFTGKVVFQNAVNGSSNFEIQDANGTGDLLMVDTVSGKVGIGRTPLATTNAILQVNGSVDLTGQITFNGNQINTLNLSDSSNIARLDANQTFSGNNTFSGNLVALNLQPAGNTLSVGAITSRLDLQGDLASSLTASDGNFNIKVGFAGTPTGNITYNFNAAASPGTYEICTTVGNCVGSGGSVATPGGTSNHLAKFTGADTVADSSISDNGSSVSIGEPGVFRAASNSSTAFRVQNAAGLIDLLVADTTDSRIGIGLNTGNTPQYSLDVAGDINSSTGLRVGGTLVCTAGGCGAGSGSGFYIQNGTAAQVANFNVQSGAIGSVVAVVQGASGQTADLLDVKDGNSNKVLSVNNTGSVLIQPSTNSQSALVVQSASPGNIKVLAVDTSNNRVAINQATAGYTLDVNGDINISTGSFFRINGTSICGPQATCAPSAGSAFYIQNANTLQTGANFNISSANINYVVGVLRGALGQIGDLLDLQNGSGNNVFGVNATGSVLAEATTNSTTAFQIQNAAGTSNLFVADTVNSRIGIGTASPTATLSVNGTGLFQAPVVGTSNSLTVTGNEITDAIRTTATAGDGRAAPDSSEGIWEGTTNLVNNGGFESNTTGWAGYQHGGDTPTISQDTSTKEFGSSSLKIVTDGVGDQQGISISPNVSASSNTTYTYSTWLKAASGAPMRLYVDESLGGTFIKSDIVTFTGTGSWQRVTNTFTTSSTTNQLKLYLFAYGTTNAPAETFWVDGIQLEQKTFASPYVDTNGSTASRSAARVQGSATTSSLTEASGWVAFRVRPGWSSSSSPSFPTLFDWYTNDFQNEVLLTWQSAISKWEMQSTRNNGVATKVDLAGPSFNSGDALTIIGFWTNTQIGISVNGSSFTIVSRGTVPGGTTLPSTFDIGSRGGTGQFADSDILWSAAGTGTLTNTDATNINAFGNTDPNLGSFASGAASSFVWQANNATYQYPSFQPIVFQVQNNAGSQLLGVDANASAVLLPNATSATAALILGNDSNANLYRSAASTLTTSATFQSAVGLQTPLLDSISGALSIGTTNATAINLNQNTVVAAGKSLTDNGTAIFRNSVDSTGAVTIQNAAGNSNLFVADTADTRLGVATATPLTTFNVSGTGLFQGTSNSPNSLTVSGNEITDATRAINQQGDGRVVPDSSYGIWESTTNLITNGGFESNTTGWTTNQSGLSLPQDTSVSKFGGASMKVVNDGSVTNQGAVEPSGSRPSVSANTIYTLSTWIEGTPGARVVPEVGTFNGTTNINYLSGSSVTLTGSWQRIIFTFTTPASTTNVAPVFIDNTPSVPVTFWLDGVQLEQKSIATPYVETNGATASRSAAIVSTTSSGLNGTQGWVAQRMRVGEASSSLGAQCTGVFEYYASDTLNRVTLSFCSTGGWQLARVGAGGNNTDNSFVTSFNTGDIVTLVAYWTPTQLGISVNGSSFTTTSDSHLAAGTFNLYLGSRFGGNSLDGDILWTASGAGTLNNADATSINSLGNTDPYTTNFSQAAYPTMVWHANNTTYQTGASLALQVQNSAGGNLLAVDSANSAVRVGASTKFQNLVDSTNALTVANAAGSQLFNVNTSNLQVSAANLQSSGSVNIVNSQGSVALAPGINSPNSLTVSGNEITDVERAQGASTTNTSGQSYDGKTNDSSTGIWEATTNLATNGGFETNLAGFGGSQGGEVITRDTTASKFGAASAKIVTNSSVSSQALANATPVPVTVGQTYTTSAWVKGATGTEALAIDIVFRDSGGAAIGPGTATNFTATTSFTRYTVTATAPSNAVGVTILVKVQGTATYTYWVDGWQLEQKAIATPYVETNGATAARSAASVTAPSSVLSANQGWFAMRVRIGWSSASTPSSFPNFFDWQTDNSNRLDLAYDKPDGSEWVLSSRTGGASSTAVVNSSPAAGDFTTVVGYWNSSTLALSVNGSVFTTTPNAHFLTPSGSSFSLGWLTGTANQADSDFMWAAAGTGTLTANDAASLNNFGNTDPTLAKLLNLNNGNASPSFAWNGSTGAYQDSTSSNGQALIYAANTSSTLTGNLIDLQSGSVPASKFSVDTSGNLVAAGSLSVGGLSTFTGSVLKPISDSTTALQVQNASGSALFTIDSTNSQISLGPAGPTPVTFVVGTKNTSGDPAGGTNGEIYYNSFSNVFRCFQAGVWVNCTGAGGGGGGGGDVNQGGNSFGTAMVLGTNDSNTLSLRTNAVNVLTLGTNGSALFKNSADSTTAFQIQNSAGTSNLLVADTTNSRIGVGTATPAATLAVNGSGLFQQSTVTNLLTTSGNEITDATRTTNTQGDGLAAPDSSYGIWEATTNGLKNGGFESGTSSWVQSGGGTTTMATDSAKAKFGANSLKAITDGTAINQGVAGGNSDGPTAASGQTWTDSAWVWAPVGASMQAFFAGRDASNVLQEQTIISFTGTGAWQRISITRTLNNATTNHVSLTVMTNAAQAITFWVDGVQIEQKAYATPYVETNGAAASRANDRVQAPIGSMNTTQGWMAMRVRLDFASTAQPGNPTVFGSLAIDNNNRLQIVWQGTPGINWGTRRVVGGVQGNSASVSDTFNAGDFRTLILKWDSGNIGLSVNGSNFVTVANSQTFTPTSFDIGSIMGGGQADSDYMWFAAGTGTLGNTDASSINGFGNTDPSLSSFPGGGTPTMVWQANTASYQNSANQSAVLSVQNSSGVNLLNVNADSSQLTANTSALFKNAINSTTALQVQNASGVGIFAVDTTNGLVNLGTPGASGANGQIVLNSTNASNTSVTLAVTSGLSASYTLKLPNAAPTASQCLQVDSVDANQLNFVTCSGGGGAAIDLQGAYNNSSTPATIATTSTAKGIIFKGGSGNDTTTLFQVQNNAGTTVLDADTTNGRVGIGTAVALATLQVNGTGLMQGTSNSPNNLTVSGSEITDVSRNQNQQGDGRTAPDSSEGIWETTTNMVPNGGFETNTSGAASSGDAATLSRDTANLKFGSASLKVVTPGTGANEGALFNNGGTRIAVSANTTYTFSIWVKADGINSISTNIGQYDSGANNLSNTGGPQSTSSLSWTRLTQTITTSSTTTSVNVRTVTSSVNPIVTTFYVDGVQFEQKAIATPYVETNGATASRGANRVQAPTSLLNATQGWFAARIRLGFNASAVSGLGAQAYQVATFADTSGTDYYDLFYRAGSQSWFMRAEHASASQGDATIAQVPSAGDLVTLVGYWKTAGGNQLGISVNGSNFTTVAPTTMPTISTPAFDIGSLLGAATTSADSDILWAASGTGTLTNTDATNINNFGNTDPYITSFAQATAPTMVWHANTASYQTGNSLAFQVQNSTGANLLNVNSAANALVANTNTNIFQNATDSTNGFAIQNAAGQSNLFVADTQDTRLGIGTATPVATVNVVGSTLIQQGNSTVLTITGNEITDASRTANTQGDGRTPPDSSEGIWEATTNYILNGGGETNATNWPTNTTGVTVTRDNLIAKFGSSSIKAVTDGTQANQGVVPQSGTGLNITAGTTVTGSVWVNGTAGTQLQVWTQIYNSDSSTTSGALTTVNLNGSWQRVVPASIAVAAGKTGDHLGIFIRNSTTSAITFWADGAQVEQKAYATPYVETNGATASRSLARVQAPSSNINATQGWASFRVRAGVANTSITTSTRFFEWDADTNNKMYLGLVVSAGPTYTWKFGRTVGGVDIATSIPSASFNAGDLITATIAWTSTQLAVSINGSAFVTASNTQIPNMSSAPTFDIGSIGGNNGTQWDGDVLWTAGGTGTLSNNDAANLNNFGNTDPMFNQLPAVGTPTMLWKANSSSYSTSSSADTAFQVNNNSGSSLLSLDATNAKLTVSTQGLFQNTTNTANAFTVNTSTGTQLFNVNTNNLQVSANNLQSSGAVNLTNASGTVSLAGSLQSLGSLTTSGNEITDATRAVGASGANTAGQSYDGKTNDSSYGVWESTTNLIKNGGAETSSSTQTSSTGGGTITITRDTTTSKFGSASFKVVTLGDSNSQGIKWVDSAGPNGNIGVSGNTTYTASAWVKGSTGTEALVMQICWYDNTGTIINCNSPTNFTATTSFARYSNTFTSPSNATNAFAKVGAQGSSAYTFWADGAQMEQKAIATPYVETNGSTQTRAAARVQAPASNLNATQGWVVMRLKMGFPSTATSSIISAGGGTSLTLFNWQNDTNNRLALTLATNNAFNINRQNGGVGSNAPSSTLTWNTDDTFTVIAAWDANNIYISVNGGAFTNAANNNIPALTNSLFDIGRRSDPTTNGWIDSNVLWTATGTGTLTSSDATNLNSLGNTDPTLARLYSLNTGAGQPTFVWNANTANFQDATNSNGQALIYAANTSGTTGNLIDVQSGAFPSSRFSVSAIGQTLVQTSTNSTTAFQIQNSSGSNVFMADTVNNQVGINTSTPNATLAVNGTGLIQASSVSNPILTVSGNEITDVTRTTNTQGDGRTSPDSSEGIWESTTNMVTNGGFESNTTGWTPVGTGTTIAQDSTTTKFGAKSLKITTPGFIQNEGASFTPGTGIGTAASGQTWTASAWVKGPAGAILRIGLNEKDSGGTSLAGTTVTFTATGSWQRVSVTRTFNQVSTSQAGMAVQTETNVQAVTFWTDGDQLEQKAYATPYVETNGGTASRSAARVQAPASTVNSTQGWFSARVRMGFASTQDPNVGSATRIMAFTDGNGDTNGRIELLYTGSSQTFNLYRTAFGNTSGGRAFSSVQTFNAGTVFTVVGYWTSTTVAISVNGAAFTTASNTLIPPNGGGSYSVEIGEENAGLEFDGDILWAATGMGTLSNTDTSNLSNQGSADPAFSTFPGYSIPTMVWQANNSSYINTSLGSNLVFNVQNSSGQSLLNIDTNSSSINLQSATSSTAALTFGNDVSANLYRSAAGTIKTDGSLVLGANLAVNGNTKLQTTTNSSTALQIQNASSTNLLVADTTNMKIGIGAAPSAATTAATFQVAGTSSVQSAAANTLTVSGNEITDATRAVGASGTNTNGQSYDGKTNDSSYGVWEATTNLVSNGGLETNATGWTTGGSNTVARDSGKAKFGSASLKATYQNNIQLALFNNITVTSGQTYTASAWVYVPSSYNGTQPQLEIDGGSVAIPLGTRNAWQRVSVTYTATSSSDNLSLIERGTVPTAGQGIYLDGVQVENKPIATPYVETNGGTAIRNAARVQAPASNLNATQGWFSVRVRMGWGATSVPGTFPTIIDWRNDNSNKLTIYYTSSTQVFTVERRAAGSSTQANSPAQSFNAGGVLTISGYWTSTTISISVNGGAFASVANTNVPTITATSYDIGSVGLNSQLDSDILWSAAGTGTLTNGDASAINGLGNADPDYTFFSSQDSSSIPTMVWKANNANYQNQLAFSVQNSTSANLLGVDVADGSVLLSNATSSAAALVLGRDANLYRVAAQTLKTDGALTVGTNLTVNGSALLQNATNSTAAFRIQNSDATNTVLAADTANGRIAINQTTANYALDVNGDINTAGLYRVNGVQIASSNLSDSADIAKLSVNNTFTGTNIFSNALNSFSGDGSGLTNLNGSNIASGTVADGRLSGNVALLNGSGPQTFSGNNKLTGTTVFRNAADSGSAVQIQNSAGTSNLFMADTTDTRIGIAAASPAYTLDVGGDINTSGTLRLNGAQISTASLSDGSNIGLLNAGNTFTGNNIFKPSVDSTTAFQIQGSTGSILLVADTTNMRLYVGNPAGDTIGALLVLANKTTAGDPAGTNGAIYYNANLGKFRCFENGLWENCLFGSQTAVKSADQTVSATAYANVSDLGFAAGSGRNYLLQCSLLASVSGNGGNISMNGPASPTSYTATFMKTGDQSAGDQFTTSNTYNDPNSSTAFQIVTSTSGTSQFVMAYTAVLKNGANAGTWQIVAKANSGGTITLYSGSTCDLRPF